MITFSCECGQKIRVPDEHAGKMGSCPKCKARITVPKPELITFAEDDKVSSSPVRLKEPTRACPYCGEEILLVAKKCKHCGEFVDGDSSNSSKASIFMEQPGVIRFRGAYEDAFRTMEAVMVQEGGRIKQKDIRSGRIESAWRYGVNMFGLRVTSDFRDLGNGDIRISIRGGFKDAVDSAGHAKKKANIIAETFVNMATRSNSRNSTVNHMEMRPPSASTFDETPYRGKSKTLAGILAILIGGLGIHKFYLGSWGWGILYLLLVWTYIPALIAFIEGIVLLCMSSRNFDAKYNYTEPSPFAW